MKNYKVNTGEDFEDLFDDLLGAVEESQVNEADEDADVNQTVGTEDEFFDSFFDSFEPPKVTENKSSPQAKPIEKPSSPAGVKPEVSGQTKTLAQDKPGVKSFEDDLDSMFFDTPKEPASEIKPSQTSSEDPRSEVKIEPKSVVTEVPDVKKNIPVAPPQENTPVKSRFSEIKDELIQQKNVATKEIILPIQEIKKPLTPVSQTIEKAIEKSNIEIKAVEKKPEIIPNDVKAPVPKAVESNKQEVKSDSRFDDWLTNIHEEKKTEEVKSFETSDENIHKPLIKEGMDEILVTPDGKSLEDMLPHLRGGKKKFDETTSEIKDMARSLNVGDKTHQHDRYLGHLRNNEEQKKKDAQRKKEEGKSFLSKYSRLSAEEKIIRRELGLTTDEYLSYMASEESLEKKEKALSAGLKGVDKYLTKTSYRSRKVDMDTLEFLAKFKMASTRTLRLLKDESQTTTFNRMQRLKNSGLVNSFVVLGLPDVWVLTSSGMALAGYGFKTVTGTTPKYSTFPQILGIGYLAACLWNNTLDVLNLSSVDDYPYNGREDETGNLIPGEILISELEIRHSLGKEINEYTGSLHSDSLSPGELYGHIGRKADELFKQNTDQEFEKGNEFLWNLFTKTALGIKNHTPDLVVVRPKNADGSSESIAVELELSPKNRPGAFDSVFTQYKLSPLYKKVIWITPNSRTARMLQQAAERVAIPDDKYDIVPVITKTGIYKKYDIWTV
jgi:hypothetical protein